MIYFQVLLIILVALPVIGVGVYLYLDVIKYVRKANRRDKKIAELAGDSVEKKKSGRRRR